MKNKIYSPNIEDGLDWIKARADIKSIEVCATNSEEFLKGGTKSASGPLLVLKGMYQVFALQSWFIHKDIKKLQDNAFQASLVARRWYQLKPFATPAANGQNLLYPLLSGDSELLHWHGQFQLANFVGKASFNNIKKNEFQSVQLRLALNNEWELLVDRSKLFNNTEKKTKKLYEHHNRFYIALADGNISKMEESIFEISSKKNNHKLNADFPIESRFISTWGVMLARLAFVKGYRLNVDSPWISSELVTSPIDNSYISNHKFLNSFDIFTALDESDDEWANWCDNLARFSPKKIGVEPLTFKKIASHLGINI
ncbi:MAG: hypothetical protein ACI9T7_002073 [Oleiphilaceae bacterium]|jgi:hypothetical protein